ncbi:MAG: hypothetical protein NZM42_12265, partial [Gemmatales bacterium]|nr:hypothetical protein [Gemmatales bacterium]
MGWLTWWRRWRLGEVRGEYKPIWQRHFGQATVHDVLRFSVCEIASSKQGRSVGKLVVQDGNEKLVIFLKRHYRLPWWPRIMAWLWPGKSSA